MGSARRRPAAIAAALAAALGGSLATAAAVTAAAQTPSGHVSVGPIPLVVGSARPGDMFVAAYSVRMPGRHPAATVMVKDATATLELRCAPSHQTSSTTIAMAGGSFAAAANAIAWLPAGASSAQGAGVLPDVCHGRPFDLRLGTVRFSAQVLSGDIVDTIDVRFRASVRATAGASWSPWTHPASTLGAAVQPAPNPGGGATPPANPPAPPVPPAPGSAATSRAPNPARVPAPSTHAATLGAHAVASPAPHPTPVALQVSPSPPAASSGAPLMPVIAIGSPVDGANAVVGNAQPVQWLAIVVALDVLLAAIVVIRRLRLRRQRD